MKVSQTTHRSRNTESIDCSPAATPSAICGFHNAEAINIFRIHANKNR
jgi:hypothetical protein